MNIQIQRWSYTK